MLANSCGLVSLLLGNNWREACSVALWAMLPRETLYVYIGTQFISDCFCKCCYSCEVYFVAGAVAVGCKIKDSREW